jgi:hypothetical protein
MPPDGARCGEDSVHEHPPADDECAPPGVPPPPSTLPASGEDGDVEPSAVAPASSNDSPESVMPASPEEEDTVKVCAMLKPPLLPRELTARTRQT